MSVTRRHLTPEQRASLPPSGEIDNPACVALCTEGDAIFTDGYDHDAYPFGLARCHVADLPLPQLVCEWAQHCYGRPQ